MAGHVRRRGQGWQARLPDPSCPATRRIERTFRTRREADNWLALQRAAVLRGEYHDPREADRPFHEVVEAWREGWDGRLSPTTANRYGQIVDRYLLPEFGHRKVGAITHETVQRYVHRLNSSGISPGTVRAIYSVLRNAMNKGVRLGMVRANPCTNIDLPARREQEMLFLTAQEVARLAEAITPAYRVLVYTAAYTGLRAGELTALRRQDVDLIRGVITVRRSLKDVSGHLIVGEVKTRASRRTVSLPRFLRDMLNEHLTDSSHPGGPQADALVFPGRQGGALRHGLFYKRHFKPAVRRALPEHLHALRFHDLRHTCASLSIAAGAHPKLVSARLGHATVQITLDRYSHLLPSVEEALADALDATFLAVDRTPA